MNKKELKELQLGEFDFLLENETLKNVKNVEVYKFNDFKPFQKKHGDFITFIDDFVFNRNKYQIIDYDIMNEKDYDCTINANSCITTDFKEWYGSKKAEVLVLWVEEVEEVEEEEEEDDDDDDGADGIYIR